MTVSKINSDYNDKLFSICVAILPGIVNRMPDDATESEIVDYAVNIARSLLAELGYVYRKGASRVERT
jgi:hypothetical protein